MKKTILYFTTFAAALFVLVSCGAKNEYDLCIYGGTASGIMAADAASKMGLDVIVIEPTCRIGGMTTGGLGRTDIGNKQVIKGLGLKFYRELGKRYGCLESWYFEPKVAAEVLKQFYDSPRIKILTDYHLVQTQKQGTDIQSITVAGKDTLTFSAKWFIDASYEGDLMAQAGVSYIIGREDNSQYGETWNGTQLLHISHQFPYGVDPFVEKGKPESGLLWGISTQSAKPNGTGDGLLQAYNFRVCLTDVPENMIKIEKPENYDPSQFELLVRLFEAQPDLRDINDYFIWFPMPNHKTDINNRGAFSTDMIGANYGYPEGSWEERQAIIKAHRDYTLGLLYFVANDPRVPAELRDTVSKWGLPKDEYEECGHFSPQLYVRESRRMIGDYVATQADCEHTRTAEDGIGYASYNMDSHNCQRIVSLNKDGKYMVENEGDVQIRGIMPYPISYRSITPKRGECTNLVVPVCLSASHIAYGSIRMEPVFMCLGQSAGIAVALAEKDGLSAIQDVDYKKIRYILDNDPYMDGTVPDIIVDDIQAHTYGECWTTVPKKGYGPSYFEGPSSGGGAEFVATADNSGEYELYSMLHVKDSTLNSSVGFDLSDGRNFSLDLLEMEVKGQSSSSWRKIADVSLEKNVPFTVRIHGNGGEGLTRADAILLIKK